MFITIPVPSLIVRQRIMIIILENSKASPYPTVPIACKAYPKSKYNFRRPDRYGPSTKIHMAVPTAWMQNMRPILIID